MSAAIALQILRCLAPPKPELPTTGGVVTDLVNSRKSRITHAPKTSIANDGKTKLYAYEVRAIIYAPNQRHAHRRLVEAEHHFDEAVLWGRR